MRSESQWKSCRVAKNEVNGRLGASQLGKSKVQANTPRAVYQGEGSWSREKAVGGGPECTVPRCQGSPTEFSSKSQRKIATTAELE